MIEIGEKIPSFQRSRYSYKNCDSPSALSKTLFSVSFASLESSTKANYSASINKIYNKNMILSTATIAATKRVGVNVYTSAIVTSYIKKA